MKNRIKAETIGGDQIETAAVVANNFEILIRSGHSCRAVAYSALGIVHALIEKLDGPGATEKACRELTAAEKPH
jgi:hypothetical protein